MKIFWIFVGAAGLLFLIDYEFYDGYYWRSSSAMLRHISRSAWIALMNEVGSVSARGWSRKFDDSIVTPDGTRLNTLREAVAYLAKTVPKSERDMLAIATRDSRPVRDTVHCGFLRRSIREIKET
jgi:hypothetical protein